MIPEDKAALVSHALHEAFGTAELDDIQQLTKGLSSDLIYRIVVRGRPYVLRLLTTIDERKDPVRVTACMKSAAEAGVAPRVWFADTTNGTTILDFVEPAPFPRERALSAIPATLRMLHALPRFPKTFNFLTAHNFFIWRFRNAGLLPGDEVVEVFRRYDQICSTYPRLEKDMVSCHMDLKPENMVFDGERVWLIDWQAAFVNDRYFDLAVAANFVLRDEADELAYLGTYFDRPPDEYERARFYLMRQILHVFYASVFLMLAAGGKPVNRPEDLPTFDELHDRIWAGHVDLADNAAKVKYALVHWQRLLQQLGDARFDQALATVAGRKESDRALLLPSFSPA